MDAVDDARRPGAGGARGGRARAGRGGGTAAGELPWLGELALPDTEGGWGPAGELVLPGSPLAAVLSEGSLGTLDPTFAAACDPGVLRAVGVLDAFALVRADDPDDLDVDAAGDWADAVLDRLPADAQPPDWPPLTAVRDLELVADWRRALALLAAAPAEALGRRRRSAGCPCRATCAGGCARTRCSTARGPTGCGTRTSTELQGLYEPAAAARRSWSCCARRSTVDDVLADVDGAHRPAATGSATRAPVRPGRAAHRLRAARRGARRRRRRPAGAGAGRAGPGGRGRRRPRRPVPTATGRSAGRAGRGRARGRGRPPRPAAGLREGPWLGDRTARAPHAVGGAARGRARRRPPGAAGAGGGGGRARAAHRGRAPGGLVAGRRGRPRRRHPAALGRALAWRAGAWSLRQALAEAFAFPDRAADLAAEQSGADYWPQRGMAAARARGRAPTVARRPGAGRTARP